MTVARSLVNSDSYLFFFGGGEGSSMGGTKK